jgi:hypothetical protein
MHKVLDSESLVDHCSPEDLKVLQKFCSTIKSPKDFKGSVCEFFLESKSAEIAEKVRLNIKESTKSRGFVGLDNSLTKYMDNYLNNYLDNYLIKYFGFLKFFE